MSVTDRYTQSQTRLHNSVTSLDTATAHWRRNAANAHLAATPDNLPQDTPDWPAILRLPAAEFKLRSTRPMLLAAQRTGGRYVVIRGPAGAVKFTNRRTFSPIDIADVQAAAHLLRDDMPIALGPRKAVCSNGRLDGAICRGPCRNLLPPGRVCGAIAIAMRIIAYAHMHVRCERAHRQLRFRLRLALFEIGIRPSI